MTHLGVNESVTQEESLTHFGLIGLIDQRGN